MAIVKQKPAEHIERPVPPKEDTAAMRHTHTRNAKVTDARKRALKQFEKALDILAK